MPGYSVAKSRESQDTVQPHTGSSRHMPQALAAAMARRMAEAVTKQAQVTTMDEADVTIIKHIREKERTLAAERGVRIPMQEGL